MYLLNAERSTLNAGKRGFTLVEMLIIILVIGILTGIIVPAVGKARNTARKTVCASNLKQIGTAYGMYVDDYRHFLPCAGGGLKPPWQIVLNDLYIKDRNLFYCPDYEGPKEGFDGPPWPITGIGYGQNDALTGYLPNSHANYDAITHRTTAILVADNKKDMLTGNYYSELSTVGDRHNGGTNVLFADFHVKWYLKKIIDDNYPEWWTPTGAGF